MKTFLNTQCSFAFSTMMLGALTLSGCDLVDKVMGGDGDGDESSASDESDDDESDGTDDTSAQSSDDTSADDGPGPFAEYAELACEWYLTCLGEYSFGKTKEECESSVQAFMLVSNKVDTGWEFEPACPGPDYEGFLECVEDSLSTCDSFSDCDETYPDYYEAC